MSMTYAQATQTTDPLTAEAAILAYIAGPPYSVDLTGYDPFSVVRALVSDQAQARAFFSTLRANLALGVNPTTALPLGDDWMDAILSGFFQEPRLPAIASTGTLVLSVPSGIGPYTYQAGGLLVEDLSTGDYYANANTAPQSVSSTSPATIPFVAQAPGVSGNPLSGDSFALVSGPQGGSLGVLVGTWTLTTAGTNAETSVAYLARCLAKWGSLGAGGNIDAYDYWIPTGTPTVTRWQVDTSNLNGPGSITVWCADSAGPATSGELLSVLAYLFPRKALGSGALVVLPASSATLAVTAVSTQDGSNANVLTQQAAALQVLLGAFPMGGTVDPALLIEILRGAPLVNVDVATVNGFASIALNLPGFAGVTGVALSSPASAFVLTASQVLAITSSLS
jgi:uncharacterized phage protein gp47/JayE